MKHIFMSAEEAYSMIVEAVQTVLSSYSTTQSSNPTAELVTAEELRNRLNICKASERSYVQAGILIPQHLGRRVYYRWDDVTAVLAAKSSEFLPSKLRKQKTA